MATLVGFSEAIVVGVGAAGRCGPGVQSVPDPDPPTECGITDGFNRPPQPVLGIADCGLNWYNSVGFSVQDNAARLELGAGPDGGFAALGFVGQLTNEIVLTMSLDTTGPDSPDDVAYMGADGGVEFVEADFATDGTLTMYTNVTTQTVTLPFTARLPFKGRIRMSAGIGYVRVWPANEDEPVAWTLTASLSVSEVFSDDFYMGASTQSATTVSSVSSFSQLDAAGINACTTGVAIFDTFVRTSLNTLGDVSSDGRSWNEEFLTGLSSYGTNFGGGGNAYLGGFVDNAGASVSGQLKSTVNPLPGDPWTLGGYFYFSVIFRSTGARGTDFRIILDGPASSIAWEVFFDDTIGFFGVDDSWNGWHAETPRTVWNDNRDYLLQGYASESGGAGVRLVSLENQTGAEQLAWTQFAYDDGSLVGMGPSTKLGVQFTGIPSPTLFYWRDLTMTIKTPSPPPPPVGGSVTVSSIAALKLALRDDSLSEIVVTNGTYVVDSALGRTADSLYIGALYALRTRPIVVRAETPGGVTFSGASALVRGMLIFQDGAHHQSWEGFHFAHAIPDDTGTIVFGGDPSMLPPHHIAMDDIWLDASLHRNGSGDINAQGIYLANASGAGPHDLTFNNIHADGSDSMHLWSAFHGFHGTIPAPAPYNITLTNFTSDGFTRPILMWFDVSGSNMHNWTINGATITNAAEFAVQFESVGAGNILLEGITSTGSGLAGFYSSLGTYPSSVPGVTFVGDSFS